MLQGRGIALVAADSPGSFLDDTPTAKLIRQVLGAIAEFDKSMTVAKLKGARQRKREALRKAAKRGERVKVEGRQNYAERCPEAVRLARELRRPAGKRPLSLRKVAAELAAKGFLAAPKRQGEPVRPYGAGAVARMVGR